MIWLVIKFLFFLILLISSGSFLVRSLSKINSYFKVSNFAISFAIMALATSIPELFVGVRSALDKASSLSLGVVLGSNIADLALVLGVIIIVAKGISIKNIVAKKEMWYMVLMAIFPIILALDKTLSRIDGAMLLLLFGFISYYIFWSRQKFTQDISKEIKNAAPKIISLIKDFLFFAFGITFLLISSKYVVDYGEELAISFNLPMIVVGITILAVSTSLPELIFETRAILNKKRALALGDLFGSVIVNSGLVLAVTALIYPINISDFSGFIFASIYLIMILGFLIFSYKKKISVLTGYLLIITYILFLIFEFIQ